VDPDLIKPHAHQVVAIEPFPIGGISPAGVGNAASANTNPVVIRRLLGELRGAGLVESRRGAGAGWSLARELGSVTLLDVYEAVEPGPLFAMHRTTPDPGCVIGHGIQPAMRGIYQDIEETLRQELARVTLEKVLRDVLAAPRQPL
jgi:DNA-binding IscR family transcriptional regulator